MENELIDVLSDPVARLREDVILRMPPEEAQISGRATVVQFFATQPAGGRLDLIRLVEIAANGQPALAAYLPDSAGRRPHRHRLAPHPARTQAGTAGRARRTSAGHASNRARNRCRSAEILPWTWRLSSGVAQRKNQPGSPVAWMVTRVPSGWSASS